MQASSRRSCHWPCTSNATSPKGPQPSAKLYPAVERHLPCSAPSLLRSNTCFLGSYWGLDGSMNM